MKRIGSEEIARRANRRVSVRSTARRGRSRAGGRTRLKGSRISDEILLKYHDIKKICRCNRQVALKVLASRARDLSGMISTSVQMTGELFALAITGGMPWSIAQHAIAALGALTFAQSREAENNMKVTSLVLNHRLCTNRMHLQPREPIPIIPEF